MAFLQENSTVKDYQDFIKEVYGIANDRDFNTWEMLANTERFLMRGLKGIRKRDAEKASLNFIISMSWFASLLNQLHVDLEAELWKRFPYACSYCGACPCVCKETKVSTRRKVAPDEARRPKSISDFQGMFRQIYPPQKRTLEHAGIHLAEEMGEFSEAAFIYRTAHKKEDFDNLALEAADLASCFFGAFNSLDVDVGRELSARYRENCHVCHKAPCECSFGDTVSFKS